MANQTVKNIILDGWRSAVVQFAGVLDTQNLSSAINLSDFTANEPLNKFTGFVIQRIRYSVEPGLAFVLNWHATTEQLIAAVTGYGKLDYTKSGGLPPTNSAASGYTGNIDVSTTGFGTKITSNANFSVEIELTKVYT